MSSLFNTEPANALAAVVASDTTILSPTARGLWVGTGGDIAIRCPGSSSAVTIKNVPDGTLLPIKTARVYATGTTAADIVALI